jgi:hypothetical protein
MWTGDLDNLINTISVYTDSLFQLSQRAVMRDPQPTSPN